MNLGKQELNALGKFFFTTKWKSLHYTCWTDLTRHCNI